MKNLRSYYGLYDEHLELWHKALWLHITSFMFLPNISTTRCGTSEHSGANLRKETQDINQHGSLASLTRFANMHGHHVQEFAYLSPNRTGCNINMCTRRQVSNSLEHPQTFSFVDIPLKLVQSLSSYTEEALGARLFNSNLNDSLQVLRHTKHYFLCL